MTFSAFRNTLKTLLFAGLALVYGIHSVQAATREITVSAAASLTNAFTDIKKAFEKQHPEYTVQTNFAASNPLLKQMEEGAPVDVFASADGETMDKAVQKQLIAVATRQNFARNDLVLILPADSPIALITLADLMKPEVQYLAVGNPESVPAGRYAKEALVAAGLWDSLQTKYVFGASVRQALEYVRRGEANAGFVYRTDAMIGGAGIRIALVADGHRPVLYPIAVTTAGQHNQGAVLFRNFVLSPEGQALLQHYGFSQP